MVVFIGHMKSFHFQDLVLPLTLLQIRTIEIERLNVMNHVENFSNNSGGDSLAKR